MRWELQILIRDYQQRVAMACQMMRERFDIEYVSPHCWRHTAKPRSGWLDDTETVAYTFHGRACHLKFGDMIVLFEFGPDWRYDGFDETGLCMFANSVPEYRPLADRRKLREELEGLRLAGELVRFSYFGLYYFPDHTTLPDTP